MSAEAPLLSPRWYRVAELRPQLRAHVELRRQQQRGTPFYVLQDLVSDNAHRLNAAAYAFVGRCDGVATVQQIWESMLAAAPEDAMAQDEAVDLLVALNGRGLMQFDVSPDVESLFHAQDLRRRRRRRGGVNPVAFRLPLGDPSRLLAPLYRFGPSLFSGTSFLVWLLVVLAALAAAAMHWSELLPYASKILASPKYLLMVWLMYPLIKAVHEVAHALALQRYGGHVHQAGITLMLLNPVPFVDASAADSLRSRHQRALVSAAGIMAELAIAAVATGVWLAVQPGLVRDLAFIAMLTGGFSTVLSNGNPLLRYDGYYVFCDLLDLRNLATRSGRYWTEGLGRHLLGVRVRVPLEVLPGERLWLRVYAPASWLYRLVLSLVIGLWVGSLSALLGLLVGGLMLASNIVLPLWRVWQMLRGALDGERDRRRVFWRAGLLGVALVGVLGWLPVPFNTLAEGVVWLPERAEIRAETDGFVVALLATDGQHVAAGDLIALLEDPPLNARRATLVGDIAETDVQLFHAIDKAPQDAPDLRERMAYSQAELARVDEMLRQREIRALAAGVLVLPRAEEVVGQFRKRGERIGYLLTSAPLLVRVALPQQDADLVRSRSGLNTEVQVRLAEDPHTLRSGRLVASVPGMEARLPSAALGDRAGGRIATDSADAQGMTPRRPVVVMDVELAGARSDRFGARAWVRFDNGYAPIASQALRSLQQLLLGHFNPGG